MSRRIFITTPALSAHGGIRVILEWANRLSENNDVVLRVLNGDTTCRWFEISPKVKATASDKELIGSDALIVTSPHSVGYLYRKDAPENSIVFMQMAEHLFRPDNAKWQDECARWYQWEGKLISISQWNIKMLKRDFRRQGPIYYVGNGVNLEHFPPVSTPSEFKNTVLVEGWTASNPTKDARGIAAIVCEQLKQNLGCRIIAYGRDKPTQGFMPDHFVKTPSLQELNDLYCEADILVKATRMDARSCSPMEAMTKGTVTARAIDIGDDDLQDNVNCLRCYYGPETFFENAARLLQDESLRTRLGTSCLEYIQTYTWPYWMEKIEEIIWQD